MGTAIEETGIGEFRQREFQRLKLENEDLKQRIVELTALLIKHLADPGDRGQSAQRRH